jgi:uroporphyrinogen decarboxylase
MKLTTVLLMGTVDDSKQDTIECMDAGGHKGFILAPGCDLPMDTPPENLKAVANLVHDPYQLQIARTMVKKDKNIEPLDLHTHWKPGKAVIDVITLDSSSCAPCQYMVEAVKNACQGMEDKVEWYEHKIKEKEGIQMMATLGVKNIPTICINGKVEFISNIPPKQELIKAIKRHLEEK